MISIILTGIVALVALVICVSIIGVVCSLLWDVVSFICEMIAAVWVAIAFVILFIIDTIMSSIYFIGWKLCLVVLVVSLCMPEIGFTIEKHLINHPHKIINIETKDGPR